MSEESKTPSAAQDVIEPAEAWEIFQSRRFLHGHRESMKESFEVVMKDLIGCQPGAAYWRKVAISETQHKAELLEALKAMVVNYGPPISSIEYPANHPISIACRAIGKAWAQPTEVSP